MFKHIVEVITNSILWMEMAGSLEIIQTLPISASNVKYVKLTKQLNCLICVTRFKITVLMEAQSEAHCSLISNN